MLLVGACGLEQTPPPGFVDYVQAHGASFAVAEPPAGEMQREEAFATVRGERERHAQFPSETPLDATFGVLMCPDVATCRDAFSANAGEVRLDLWVVGSLTNGGPQQGRWLAVNARTGFFSVSGPD